MIDRFSWQEERGGPWTHTFLSNGYIESDGSFVEREYQAYAKTVDPGWRTEILACTQPFGPYGSKRRGREAPLRPDHEEVKFQVMAYFVAKKFRDHPVLAQSLADTVGPLIEGNTWHDNIWGDCTCGNASGRQPDCVGVGTNWLGLILMTTREHVRAAIA